MNAGPTDRGCLDARAEDALAAFGKWMKYNSRSIYGCTMAEPEFKAPNGCKFTQSADGKRLYVHIFEYPYENLILPGMAGKVDYAQFLYDGSEVQFKEESIDRVAISYKTDLTGTVVLKLPVIKPNTTVPVVEIFLK